MRVVLAGTNCFGLQLPRAYKAGRSEKNPCMPHYQPIIPSCLVKLKRGLNPDLTGVIKLIFFFSPGSKKDLGC